MSYEAFVLPAGVRSLMEQNYPPKFPEFIGHHITHVYGGPFNSEDQYGKAFPFELVGYAMEDGLEAFVVSIGDQGTTRRPDGKLYHLTWSLDRSKGKKPVDSNILVAKGFGPVSPKFASKATLQLIK